MEPIVWTDAYSVGVARVDEQHKRLIDMLNRLAEAAAPSTKSEIVGDILSDMTQYAIEHFRAEEELLERHGYKALESHHEEHRLFRRKTVTFCTAVIGGVEEVSDEMLDFLHDWLQHHILKIDMAYKPFLNGHGVK